MRDSPRDPKNQRAKDPKSMRAREPKSERAKPLPAKEILHYPQGNYSEYESITEIQIAREPEIQIAIEPEIHQRHGMHRICISAIRQPPLPGQDPPRERTRPLVTAATTDGRYSSAPRYASNMHQRQHPQETINEC